MYFLLQSFITQTVPDFSGAPNSARLESLDQTAPRPYPRISASVTQQYIAISPQKRNQRNDYETLPNPNRHGRTIFSTDHG